MVKLRETSKGTIPFKNHTINVYMPESSASPAVIFDTYFGVQGPVPQSLCRQDLRLSRDIRVLTQVWAENNQPATIPAAIHMNECLRIASSKLSTSCSTDLNISR